MTEEKKLFLIMAKEPLWKNEHWVTVYRDKEGYAAEFGDERGHIDGVSGNSLDVVSYFYSKLADYGMKKDSKAEVEKENAKLTLEDIVRLYGEEGDNVKGGVDGFLENLKEVTGIRSNYKTLLSVCEGGWVKATIRRGKEKLYVYFDDWMIKKIEVLGETNDKIHMDRT